MEHEDSVFVAAGDPSADFPGKLLIEEIRSACPKLSLFGLGGRMMQEAGLRPLADFKQLAILGFWEVAPRFLFFRRLLADCVREIERHRPRAVILIDYPGFNLRLAKRIHALNIPIIYFISPQVWAWGARRLDAIRHLIAKMLVIFPFEVEFFEQRGIPATFVGHPIADRFASMPDKFVSRGNLGLNESEKVVALLPGSRAQEVKRMFPAMVRAAEIVRAEFPDLRFVCAGMNHLDETLYTRIIGRRQIEVHFGFTPDIINAADLVVTSSGTATIECAWLCAPMVVIYKTGFFTYHIARRLIMLDKIAMVNIVAGEIIVPELVQNDAAPERIASEVMRLLRDKDAYRTMVDRLRSVRGILGQGRVGKNCLEAIKAVVPLC